MKHCTNQTPKTAHAIGRALSEAGFECRIVRAENGELCRVLVNEDELETILPIMPRILKEVC